MSSPEPALRALHVGDLHFWRIPINPFAYFSKRLLGVGNLLVGGRGRKFRQELAPLLVQRLRELKPDLFLFSGDFSSTSVRKEFAAARFYLEPAIRETPLGAYSVPGNHDCYTPWDLGARTFQNALGQNFRPCTGVDAAALAGGQVGVLQINATTSNGLGSHGAITSVHVAAIREHLQAMRGSAKVLWLLCHFPGEDPPKHKMRYRGPQLENSVALFEELATLGVPIFFLHGHHHHRWIYASSRVENMYYLNAGAPLLKKEGDLAPDLGFHELQYKGGRTQVLTHRFHVPSKQWHSRPVPLPEREDWEDLQRWETEPG